MFKPLALELHLKGREIPLSLLDWRKGELEGPVCLQIKNNEYLIEQ